MTSPANTPVIRPLGVQRHVEQEQRLDQRRRLPHLFPDRVAVGDPPGGARIADHGVAVVGEHALAAGQRGQGALGAAGEAGEEVRLDEAGEDHEVRLHHGAVQADGVSAARGAGVDQLRVVPGVVLPAAVAVDDAAAQHLPQLRLRLRAVGAQGVDQGDVVPRHPGVFQRPQQHRQDAVVGRGARDVRVGHHHPPLARRQIGQRRRAGGRRQRCRDRRRLVVHAVHVTGQHHLRGGRHLDGESVAAVRQIDPFLQRRDATTPRDGWTSGPAATNHTVRRRALVHRDRSG